jgi:hypothetical protein
MCLRVARGLGLEGLGAADRARRIEHELRDPKGVGFQSRERVEVELDVELRAQQHG